MIMISLFLGDKYMWLKSVAPSKKKIITLYRQHDAISMKHGATHLVCNHVFGCNQFNLCLKGKVYPNSKNAYFSCCLFNYLSTLLVNCPVLEMSDIQCMSFFNIIRVGGACFVVVTSPKFNSNDPDSQDNPKTFLPIVTTFMERIFSLYQITLY